MIRAPKLALARLGPGLLQLVQIDVETAQAGVRAVGMHIEIEFDRRFLVFFHQKQFDAIVGDRIVSFVDRADDELLPFFVRDRVCRFPPGIGLPCRESFLAVDLQGAMHEVDQRIVRRPTIVV